MSDHHTDSRSAEATLDQPAPAHQDFRWIEGPHQHTPYAEFLELTLDISAGLHTGMQIAYASELEYAANADADPGQMRAPAVGLVEADRLKRMAIAAAALLHAEAKRRVALLSTSPQA